MGEDAVLLLELARSVHTQTHSESFARMEDDMQALIPVLFLTIARTGNPRKISFTHSYQVKQKREKKKINCMHARTTHSLAI